MSIMKERYLITGAAGHLGGVIVRELVQDGKAIRALVLEGDKAAERLPGEVEQVTGDVRDQASLHRFFDVSPDAEVTVIHCAGIVTLASEFSQTLYDVNVTGTKNVVDECLARGVKKLVYVSSVHAIPALPHGQTMREVEAFDPDKVIGPYAKTKAEATAYVQEAVKKGLNAAIVYPGGIYGPYDYSNGHVTQSIVDFYAGRMPVSIEGGFDLVDVRDVAQGVIACVERGRQGEGYILANRYVSNRELYELLHQITGTERIKFYIPLWLAKASLPLFALYYKLRNQPSLLSAYTLYTLSVNSHYSHEKAARELGYRVRPFEETARDTVEWLKSENRI